MMKSANPRRQLGQYRHMIERQRKVFWWSMLFWLVPLVLVALAHTAGSHWALKAFLWIAFVSGVIQQVNEHGRLRDYEQNAKISEGRASTPAQQAVAADRPKTGAG